MSAYMEFKDIKFLNAALLVKTLQEMGYQVEVGQSLTLYGYHGDARPERAQIVVRRDQIGSSSNDLGFAWNGTAFVPIISEYDAKCVLTEEWRQKLQDTYGKLAVLQFLYSKNAQIQWATQKPAGFTIRATVEVPL